MKPRSTYFALLYRKIRLMVYLKWCVSMHIYTHTCTHNMLSIWITSILIYVLDQKLSHNQLSPLQLMNFDLHNKEEHVHICKSVLETWVAVFSSNLSVPSKFINPFLLVTSSVPNQLFLWIITLLFHHPNHENPPNGWNMISLNTCRM